MTEYEIDSAAAEEIENEGDIAFDVAAMNGQIFHNVKHMRWFRNAVRQEICDTLEG